MSMSTGVAEMVLVYRKAGEGQDWMLKGGSHRMRTASTRNILHTKEIDYIHVAMRRFRRGMCSPDMSIPT